MMPIEGPLVSTHGGCRGSERTCQPVQTMLPDAGDHGRSSWDGARTSRVSVVRVARVLRGGEGFQRRRSEVKLPKFWTILQNSVVKGAWRFISVPGILNDTALASDGGLNRFRLVIYGRQRREN